MNAVVQPTGGGKTAIRPFQVNFPETELTELRRRIEATRWFGRPVIAMGEAAWGCLDGMNAERILIAAECIGDARFFIERATAYAKQREVFGRPIGQFQAVKHKCANMIAETERATGAVWDAARALDDGDASYEFAAAVAATLSPAAAQHCTQDCIQVHGGIGFTWEHQAHLYFRRAKSSEYLLGSPVAHREALLQRLGV